MAEEGGVAREMFAEQTATNRKKKARPSVNVPGSLSRSICVTQREKRAARITFPCRRANPFRRRKSPARALRNVNVTFGHGVLGHHDIYTRLAL